MDDGMMVSTVADFLLVYQSALAVTSSLVVLSTETSLEQVGEWMKEMRI
jgi:hypothetical protein